MGTYIHAYAEEKSSGVWKYAGSIWKDMQSYRIFGFLADVRNYSKVGPIYPARGIPDDLSESLKEEYEEGFYGGASYLTLEELLFEDYDQVVEDRRITKQISDHFYSGAETSEEGKGQKMTLRDFLGLNYFDTLEELGNLGKPEEVRIVFWFSF